MRKDIMKKEHENKDRINNTPGERPGSEALLAYVKGTLSKEEAARLEEHFIRDSESWEEVETLMKLEEAGALDHTLHTMRNRVEKALVTEALPPSAPVVRRLSKRFWYQAAAVLLLLCSLSFYFYTQNKTLSPERLFTSYFEPVLMEEQFTRGEGKKELEQAAVEYREGHYREALELYEKSLESATYKSQIRMYMGNCYLALGTNPEQAVRLFQEILRDQNSGLQQKANWYLALAYLKNQEPEQAIAQLKKIATHPKAYHKEQALTLLKKLERD